MCPSLDRDLNHVTEAVQETAIERNAIRLRNRDLSLVRDQNLHRDPDQDRGVNLAVNDREATIIRCKHCQGRNNTDFVERECKLYTQFIYLFLFIYRYYGRRGKSSSLELELSDNEEKSNSTIPKTSINTST